MKKLLTYLLSDLVAAALAGVMLMLVAPYLYAIGAQPVHPGYWPCFAFVYLGQGVIRYMFGKAELDL